MPLLIRMVRRGEWPFILASPSKLIRCIIADKVGIPEVLFTSINCLIGRKATILKSDLCNPKILNNNYEECFNDNGFECVEFSIQLIYSMVDICSARYFMGRFISDTSFQVCYSGHGHCSFMANDDLVSGYSELS